MSWFHKVRMSQAMRRLREKEKEPPPTPPPLSILPLMSSGGPLDVGPILEAVRRERQTVKSLLAQRKELHMDLVQALNVMKTVADDLTTVESTLRDLAGGTAHDPQALINLADQLFGHKSKLQSNAIGLIENLLPQFTEVGDTSGTQAPAPPQAGGGGHSIDSGDPNATKADGEGAPSTTEKGPLMID